MLEPRHSRKEQGWGSHPGVLLWSPRVHGVGKAGRFAPGETGVTLLAVIIPQEAGERPGAAGNTPPHWPRYGRGGRRELSPALISIVLQGTSGTILPDLMSFAGLFFFSSH